MDDHSGDTRNLRAKSISKEDLFDGRGRGRLGEGKYQVHGAASRSSAAASSFTLTGLLGYTLDRCVFSFPTVQFKKQLIVWSLYF